MPLVTIQNKRSDGNLSLPAPLGVTLLPNEARVFTISDLLLFDSPAFKALLKAGMIVLKISEDPDLPDEIETQTLQDDKDKLELFNEKILSTPIEHNRLANNAISRNIGALKGDLRGLITSPTIKDGSITSNKLANGAVFNHVGVLSGSLAGSTLANPQLADRSVHAHNLCGCDGEHESPLAAVVFDVQAGVGGAPDDVEIYGESHAAPFDMRVLDAMFVVSDAVVDSTVTVRTESDGGGDAMTDAFSCAATGRVRDSGSAGVVDILEGQSLYLRRSDSAVAGTLVLTVHKL